MKISVIVPVGDEAAWKDCEKSISASIGAYAGPVEWEVLPCLDLAHRGAYTARNEGLGRATGDYVAWVDCDDRVENAWATEIAAGVSERSPDGRPVDVLVFDVTQVRDGVSLHHRFGYPEWMDGAVYGKRMVYGIDAPHWLWNRVFRREIVADVRLTTPVNEDYQLDLWAMPRTRCVRYVPHSLYRYIRSGKGLSGYTRTMDWDRAARGYLSVIEQLPHDWRKGARMGLGLLLPDVVLHDPKAHGVSKWVRRYALRALFGREIRLKFKFKVLLAALMFWK